jgi:hypothetical protein
VYDDRIELPKTPPDRMVQYLMEQRSLKQADLLPIFGARSLASDVLTGKREPSKAQIRKLAEFLSHLTRRFAVNRASETAGLSERTASPPHPRRNNTLRVHRAIGAQYH